MTSCFLKLYTPTRVCEVIIRNWSAGQLVTPNSRIASGGMEERKAGIQCRGMDIRRRKTRSRNSRAQDARKKGNAASQTAQWTK